MQKTASLNQNKNRNLIPSDESLSKGYDLKKDVVLFVVRQSLLASGKEAFEMINRSLLEKYRCELLDCFEKPEYLLDVLKYVYDGSYASVVESIKRSLDKFAQDGTIKQFLEKLN